MYVDVDAYVDVDMDALFDPFCDALLNFTDCLSDYSGALNTEDVLRSLPHKMIRYCQTKGDLSFITNCKYRAMILLLESILD